jgi:hypothetical protein
VRKTDFAAGVLLGAALVGFIDVLHARHRMPEPPTLAVLALAWVVSTGALASVAVPALVGYRTLWERTPRRLLALVGALGGATLGSMALLLDDTPSVPAQLRVALVLAITIGSGGTAALLTERLPRLLRVLGLAVGCFLLAWIEDLLPYGRPLLRLTIDLLAIGAAGAAWEGFRPREIPTRAVVRTFVAVAILAPAGIWLVPAVRSVVFEFGTHARAVATWASSIRFGEKRLGNVACDGGRPPSAPAPRRSPLSGAAGGADVLFLTFDAMRWDRADTMPELWRELGPHVSFSRAVSPAPRTEHSFGALLRGVPARIVPDGKAAEHRPTLGEVLRRRGYRAVQVPTHRYFAEHFWANDGFELAVTAEFATVKKRIVRADPVLKKGLELARSTEGPLFLWIHLMEGHEPYYHRDGRGPRTPEGQRRAFRELDRPAAEFVREFRRSRAGRNVVVAAFGDHGEEFREHGTVFHSTSVYAEQVRSVFVLAGPGLASARVDAPVSLAALPATIIDLIDEKPVPSFTEPSLLGCIASREACPTVAVSQMNLFGAWVGYTFERHRLLADPEHGIERLYDSATDPLEQRDLAKSEPVLMEKLRERAREFDRRHCVVE